MKRMNALYAGALLVIGILLAACSASGANSIAGEWGIVSYGSASNPTPAIPGVETSISFNEDGRFGGNAGCNSFGGEYKFRGESIAFDSITSTMMYCEATAEQESAVISILSASNLTMTLDGRLMTLTSADGSVIVLARK